MINLEKKMLSLEELLNKINTQELKRPLVFTNGVFDLLHRGHVSYLDEAAQLGASLIVAVNSDASVKRLNKGPERPLNSQEDRQALLAALQSVDAVIVFDEDTPYEVIQAIKPDWLVKGGDYEMSALPETGLLKDWNGKAVAIDFKYQRSTTALVHKIKNSE